MQKDNIITILISVIASVVISVALAASVAGKSPVSSSSQDLNQAIEDYLMEHPAKIREALELAAQQEQIEAQKRVAINYKNTKTGNGFNLFPKTFFPVSPFIRSAAAKERNATVT